MSTSPPPRVYDGKPVLVRRAERRMAFVEAGLNVFGNSGFDGSSVSQICSEAGLARAQFYAEYKDREALLISVYDYVQTSLRNAVVESIADLPAGVAVRDVAGTAVRALFEFIASNPNYAQVSYIEMQGVSDTVRRYRAERRHQWAVFFEATVRHYVGQDHRPPGGYELAASAFLGALTELGMQWLAADPRPPVDRAVSALTAVLDVFVSTQQE